MIAALAGGSLPFILRMVMQPEKPDIEIGTVSFKNQLDEVIKNFVQYWPIYDLPFKIYTKEDEEEDRQKAEDEQKQKNGDKGGERKKNDSYRRGSFDRGQAAELLRNPPVYDMVDESANNNRVDCVDKAVRSSPSDNEIHPPPPQQIVDESQHESPDQVTIRSPKVCFGGDLNDKPEFEPDVDIVIYLPLKHEEAWLDQWSDLDEVIEAEITELLDNDDAITVDNDQNVEIIQMQNTQAISDRGTDRVDGQQRPNSRTLTRQ